MESFADAVRAESAAYLSQSAFIALIRDLLHQRVTFEGAFGLSLTLLPKTGQLAVAEVKPVAAALGVEQGWILRRIIFEERQKQVVLERGTTAAEVEQLLAQAGRPATLVFEYPEVPAARGSRFRPPTAVDLVRAFVLADADRSGRMDAVEFANIWEMIKNGEVWGRPSPNAAPLFRHCHLLPFTPPCVSVRFSSSYCEVEEGRHGLTAAAPHSPTNTLG